MGSRSEVSLSVIPSAGDETDSTSSSINFNFKIEIEQNPDLKAIAENYFVLIEDRKAKVTVADLNINNLLSTVAATHRAIIFNFDLKELDRDNVSLKIIPDDLDSGPLNVTTGLILLQKDQIWVRQQSIEWRRRVYNFTIMIAVIIMLAVSTGLAVAGERLAAVVTATLAMAIKATETYLNVMSSEEERMVKEEKEVVEMMRKRGKKLMAVKFNTIKQKANTLKEKFVTEYSKLLGHSQLVEKSKMMETMETINKIEYDLTVLKSIIYDYSNDVQNFIDEFTAMVTN